MIKIWLSIHCFMLLIYKSTLTFIRRQWTKMHCQLLARLYWNLERIQKHLNSWQNIILVTCACVYKHCFCIKEILQLYYCTYIICPPIVDFPASVNKIKNEFSNIRSLCLSLSLQLLQYPSLVHSQDLPTCPMKTTLTCSFLGPRLSWASDLTGAGSSSSSSSSSSFISASSAASSSHFSVASVNKHTNQGLSGQVTNAYIRFVYDDKNWSENTWICSVWCP